MRAIARVLIAVAAVAGPFTVSAETIDFQSYSSATNPTTTYGSPIAFTDNGNVFDFLMFDGSDGPVTASISATPVSAGIDAVTVSFSSAWTAPACISGDQCLEGGYLTVQGASVTAASYTSGDITGLAAGSRISAYGGGAFVNLEGLSTTGASTFTFDETVAPVPLPADFTLLLSALGGLFLIGFRKSAA